MKGLLTSVLLTVCAAGSGPRFEAADVHPSVKTQHPYPRTGPVRNGRYEVKAASIADLIAIAYGYSSDKILGGPSWLEVERFDIAAKVPADSTSDAPAMLRNLLADRFKLVVRQESKPLPAYALTPGKKLLLKEATGGGEMTGCKPQAGSAAPPEGGMRLMGTNITYHCRNISMSAFAAGLRGMLGANLGTTPVLDETRLTGNWNFDLRYSIAPAAGPANDTAERMPIAAAIEKQLGLKLEEKPVPTPVIVVVSVNRTPTANAPNISEMLPPAPVATSFEVASVKPSNPGSRISRMQTLPGGRLVIEGMTLQFLVSRAFDTFNNEEIVGAPPFAQSERFDIVAKLPAGYTDQTGLETLAPLLLDLLRERFKLQYHQENREVATYSLVAVKPKMKQADPESRTSCRLSNAPATSPAGTRLLTCRNVTMAYFAERLQGRTPSLGWPVSDATGLDGGWDLALTFSDRPAIASMGLPGPPPPPAGGAIPSASDPSGTQTIFEAIEKQLGLKLEKVKKAMPVIVIDHLEPKPTGN